MNVRTALIRAFEEINQLPYLKENTAEKSNSEHKPLEDAIIEILRRHLEPEGFTYFDCSNEGTRKLNGIKSKERPRMSILFQPNGSRRSPDFIIVLDDGEEIKIESKSASKGHPAFNDSYYRQDSVYIYSGPGTYRSGTTFALGSEYSPNGETDKIKDEWDKIKQDVIRHANTMLAERLKEGNITEMEALIDTLRPKWKPNTFTELKWMDRPDKKNREQRVFEYLEGAPR